MYEHTFSERDWIAQ